MNYWQLALFFVFVSSVGVSGVAVYRRINIENHFFLNKWVLWGECLLLGSVIVVAQLLCLSFVGLYHAPFLWGTVVLNFLWLLDGATRQRLKTMVTNVTLDVPGLLFGIFVAVFFFRNFYFLVDVDSHSTYLFTQKVWLARGTSLFADRGWDARIFLPQFDAVPYALGISVFGQETLFPQLVNWFWRCLVLILVGGYTRYRFNGYYALAACLLIVFNEHFFYSGVNQAAVINGALAAFLFASVYNFWESRDKQTPFRLLLALAFLAQCMANKYQIAYAVVLVFGLGIMLQVQWREKIKEIWVTKRYRWFLVLTVVAAALWYIKNWIITGVPTFPVFAGKFQALGWTPAKGEYLRQLLRGASVPEFLKYGSYFFVWPGIKASKVVGVMIFLSPLAVLLSLRRQEFEKARLFEFFYWLGASLLILLGLCLACYQDPRYYRYAIAVHAFAAVFALDYILIHALGIRRRVVVTTILLLVAVAGAKIIFSEGTNFRRPYLADNLNVLLNKMHMDEAIQRHYPGVQSIVRQYHQYPEKTSKSAWDMRMPYQLSAFLLPQRPQIRPRTTNIIQWPSYQSAEKIVQDLREYGLNWVMDERGGKLVFLTLEEFAKEAATLDQRPKTVAFPYQLPAELQRTKF